jgi:hypothetical protein
MASTLQVENLLSSTAQSVQDQNGNASSLTVSTDKVGIGTAVPISTLHVVSAVDAPPPRLQSSPGGTGSFAAGWDFYLGDTGKGYVGVPNESVGFGAGELLLFGGPETRTSLWAGSNRSVTLDTFGNVGIGLEAPISRLHIFAAGNAPRLESPPGGANFACGWDFYSGGVGKGYVGVPDAGAGFGAGEMLLYGGPGTRTSLWAGSNRGITLDTNGNVGIGTSNPTEKLEVNGNIVTNGDIRLTNADCAEDFDISDTEQMDPGTVVVLGEEGVLHPSQQAYDKRVAGVISGAGNYKPGIVLDRQEPSDTRKPIALLGKAYCKADAGHGAIEIGDLLTTSPTPGCAMKAADPIKAFGTVIGKALRPLGKGQGLIPILVALQ